MTRRFLTLLLCTVPQLALAKLGDAAPETSTAGNVLQMLVGLAIVLGILVGGAMLLRRIGRFPASVDSPLRIVTGMSLGPRDRLVVVQVGEKQLLLGLSPGRIQTLHVLEAPLESGTPTQPGMGALSQKFSAMLQSHMKKPS